LSSHLQIRDARELVKFAAKTLYKPDLVQLLLAPPEQMIIATNGIYLNNGIQILKDKIIFPNGTVINGN
jgi:hypothetical protein